ncbi:MAG TPA: hypothetical protein VF088_12985 [Pyrinomonadaceae bacterium]
MKIQTSKVYVAKVRTDVEPHLGEFVKSDEHHIAVSDDIGKSIELRPEAKVTVPSGQTLQAVPTTSPKMTAEKRLAIEKAAMTFVSTNLPMIKKIYPQLGGPIEGVELVFASKIAFDAWTDPERKSMVKPVIKTARAFVEFVDVAAVAVPALKKVPYLEAVGVVLKVGDSAFAMWTDIVKPIAGSDAKH